MHGLLPHDGVLSPDELETIVTAIRDDPALWRPLVRVDAERRRFELLYEDDRTDIWVLSWSAGQGTGFHDHGVSSVGIAIAAGALEESNPVLGGEPLVRVLRPGSTRRADASYIHKVRHREGEPAVSIHAYSPPLVRVGQYRVDPTGALRRSEEPGRVELTDAPWVPLFGPPATAAAL
jgi:hypothetical protein